MELRDRCLEGEAGTCTSVHSVCYKAPIYSIRSETSHGNKDPEDGLRTPHRDGPGLQGRFEKQPQVSSKEIRIRVKAKGCHQDADGCEDTGRVGLVVGVGRAPRGLGEDQQLQHFESLEQLPCSDRENNSGRTHTFQPRPPATALPQATVLPSWSHASSC